MGPINVYQIVSPIQRLIHIPDRDEQPACREMEDSEVTDMASMAIPTVYVYGGCRMRAIHLSFARPDETSGVTSC